MKPELRAKIIAYNKTVAERSEKANDLDILVAEIMKLPPGQLKKVLTDDECRWVDTGVVSALQMAVRVNRATVDKVAGASAVRTLFD